MTRPSISRNAVLRVLLVILAVVGGERRAFGALVEVAGPRTFEIRPRDASTSIAVDVPLKPIAADARPDRFTVLRAMGPGGSQADAAFGFKLDDKEPKLRATVEVARISLPGNYLVLLEVGLKDKSEVLELTFTRPAPLVESSPLVFDCVVGFGRCELSPEHMTFTESSVGGAAASNLRVVFKSPLKASDSSSVSPPSVERTETLPASGQARAKVTRPESLPVGTISGVATIKSSEAADVSLPVEIRCRFSRWYLVLLLLAGFSVGAAYRLYLVKQVALEHSIDDARERARKLRSRARSELDPTLRHALLQHARALETEASSTTSPEGIAAVVDAATKAVTRATEDAETRYTKHRAAREKQLDALASADLLPRHSRAMAAGLATAMRAQLRSVRSTSDEQLEEAQHANIIELGRLRGLLHDWASDLPGALDTIGKWKNASDALSSVGELAKQFSTASDDAAAVTAAARLAEQVRYKLLGVALKAIVVAAQRVRATLETHGDPVDDTSLSKFEAALATARSFVGADAQDVMPAASAVRSLRVSLIALLKDAAHDPKNPTMPPELASAIDEGRFDEASQQLDGLLAGRPKNVIMGASPDGATGRRSVDELRPVPSMRAATALADSARDAGEDAAAREEPSPRPRLPSRARLAAYAVMAAVIGAAGYLVLAPTFVGEARDVIVALLWSFGTDVCAASVSGALKGAVPSPLTSTLEKAQ